MNPLTPPTSVSLLPVANVVLLGLGGALALALVWWPQPGSAQPSVVGRVRRTALVLFVLGAALRPGLPGAASVRVDSADLNVFFVVDTTTSSVAEDHGGGTRLAGMRADITAIAGHLSGARFALITFDRTAVVRMPLTSDGAAVAAAADTLMPETSAWSQGSSVTVAGPLLQEMLDRAAQSHPERSRVVFYLGDGEHTAATGPAPLGVDRTLVTAGGAVLGYGTASGGQMRRSPGSSGSSPDWVLDPSTRAPARSVIDEGRLRDIAGQLGVGYLHRSAGASVDPILDTVNRSALQQVSVAEDGPLAATRQELYWVALLGAFALLAWEAGESLRRLWALRRPASGSSVSAPPNSGHSARRIRTHQEVGR